MSDSVLMMHGARTSELIMPRSVQESRKRSTIRSSVNTSWPIEEGRNQDCHIHHNHVQRSESLAVKPTMVDDQRSLGSSWCTDESELEDNYTTADSPVSSESSIRDARTDSTCSDCRSGYLDQASIMSCDKLPSQQTLDLAGEIMIYDGNREGRPFKSLYTGADAIGEQQLIVFVRHFFCTACQGYLRAMSRAISMRTYLSLPIPTSITIIGLGDPSLIPAYRSHTSTKFPIFTDPSRKLHKLLGMGWSLSMGRRPEYDDVGMRRGGPEIARQFRSLEPEVKEKRLKAGGFWWIGGEFLVRDGKVVWCHRMRNYRDHVEMDVIKDLLGIERY